MLKRAIEEIMYQSSILSYIFIKLKMYRTHNNGELRIENIDQKVKLCGWVQKARDLRWHDLY